MGANLVVPGDILKYDKLTAIILQQIPIQNSHILSKNRREPGTNHVRHRPHYRPLAKFPHKLHAPGGILRQVLIEKLFQQIE